MIMEKLQFIERTAEYEIIADLADDCKPLGENEGRTGYFHVCKEGENSLTSGEPMYGFRIGKYEDIMKDWANHADNIGTLGENEGRIGLFQEVKDWKKEPIIVSEYESNHKPVRLPC